MLEVHELIHLILSLAAGIVLARYFRNKWLVVYSILIGVFVDLDHFFDYFLYKKTFSLNLYEFFSGVYFDATNKVILPLHGLEYVIMLAVSGIICLKARKNRKVMAGVFFVLSLSLFFHLTFDTINYRPKWPTYFITYRAYNSFSHDAFWNLNNE